MNAKRIRFIFDGEIEKRENRGLSGLDRVRTEPDKLGALTRD